LQKLLASAGYGSRRGLEKLIREGRILVDGQPAGLGQKVRGDERIQIDGRTVKLSVSSRPQQLLAYHKPEGEICTRHDPEGRPGVYDQLPPLAQGRWVGIGRLDINSSGLLLFTTDGELANRLMHPSRPVDREYAVRVLGDVSEKTLTQLLTGIELEDGAARFSDIRDGGGRGANHWYYVVIQEGRNREVRRMWQSQGVQVSRLVRVRYGTAVLDKQLRPGQWAYLDRKQTAALYRTAGLPAPQQPPRSTPGATARKRRKRKAGRE